VQSATPILLAALVVLGCQGNPGESGTGELRSVSEIPDRYRQVLEDYGAGEERWAERRAEVRADPELAQFVVDNLIVEMVRAFSTATVQVADSGPYERAQAELVRFADVSTPTLVELLGLPDDLVVFVAGQTLVRIGRPACEPVAGRLDDESWKVRLRAAELLGELPHAGRAEPGIRQALAERISADPEWVVRARAALAAGSRGARDRELAPWRALLVGALADPDPSVVRSAAEGLATLGDPSSVPALIEALDRTARAAEMGPARAIQEALVELTGLEGTTGASAWRHWWSFEGQRWLRAAEATAGS